MIRKMLGLALEAAKEEIRIWKNPARELPAAVIGELAVRLGVERPW